MNRLSIISCTAVLLAVAAGAQAAQPRFAVTALDVRFRPNAFNADLVMVGHDESYQPALMDEAGLLLLWGIGGREGDGFGINASGVVAGTVNTAERVQRAARWVRPDQVQDLGTLPGGSWAVATGINDAGKIVGTSGTATPFSRAFMWSDGKMKNLGVLPGGNESRGAAINAKGQVTGTSTTGRDGGLFQRAFRWHKGVMTELGFPPGHDTPNMGMAINGFGDVAGTFIAADTQAPRPFVYRQGRMVDIGNALPGPTVRCQATAINASRHVVGWCGDWDTLRGGAFYYNGRVSRMLDDLLDAGSQGWTVSGATAIDDQGRIIGTAQGPDGNYHGVLLTPVTPTTAEASASE